MSALPSWEIPGNLPGKMVVDGKRIDANTGERIESMDPATGRVLGSFPIADDNDIERAVMTSKTALNGDWRAATPVQRARILMKAAGLIRRDAELLARVETLDSGKPLREARGDIETAATYFEYYAGVADKLQGDSIPLGQDFMSFTLREPMGVTAHIIPWNFPLVTTSRGVAPALAAGCTTVVKPAEQTTLTSLMLADLLDEAGLPKGVYNVVTGAGATGAALAAHPEVRHVTFTGSVPTGIKVMKSAADHVAQVTLELGGKSPLVVLEDADLDAAVEGTLKAIFLNAGQVCSAGSRLVVERGVHDEMLERLVARSERMSVGHGLDDKDLGPIISRAQLDKIAGYVDGARERGISVAAGGVRPATGEGLEDGFFYAPTILDRCPTEDAVVQEEIFGPVLAVQVVDSAEEALTIGNGTEFGLVAGIYTRDITRALRFARDIEAGQVFINQYFAGGVPTPFGGTKNSGFGREKGMAGLDACFQTSA